jgi:hypothetical protein
MLPDGGQNSYRLVRVAGGGWRLHRLASKTIAVPLEIPFDVDLDLATEPQRPFLRGAPTRLW